MKHLPASSPVLEASVGLDARKSAGPAGHRARSTTQHKRVPVIVVGLLALAAMAPAQGKQTFTGTITDNMCARAGHAQMRMGPTDAECTIACIRAHDALYVLDDGKDAYTLSDQKTPEKFAAQKVRVVGVLDARTKTIRVDSITAAQ